MKNLTKNRFLAAVLALVMVISMLPLSIFAADAAGSYVQVTDLAEITAGGKFVLVAESEGAYKAVETKTTGKPSAVAVTVADGTVTGDSLPVWTIASMDGGVSLSVDGAYLGYESSTNFATAAEPYAWAVTAGENGFTFVSATVTNRGIFYQVSGDRFGAYSTSNTSGYVTELLVFKYTEGSEETPTETTAPVETTVPETTAPEAAPALEDGAQVVIYAPGYMKALSATKTGNYNVGVDVTIEGSTMSGYGETEIWTVIVNDDGTYSFANGGQNIAMADSYSSMDLGAANDKWELIDLGEGLYNVKNVVRGNFMEWYDKYSNWSTYGSSSAATDPQFQIAFFPVTTAEEPVPTDPEETVPEETTPEEIEPAGMTAELVTDVAELTEGAEIIIVAADADASLSTTQNSNNRAVADVTKSDNIVTYGEDTQVITIEAGTVSGTYALFVGEGYLYAASSDKNWLRTEAEKSDNSAWTISIDDSGIATIKANGENGRNWLRYNSGNNIFSCYASGQKDVKIYKIVKEPVDPLANGSTVVIYVPGYMKALSAEKTGNYNAGVDVTIDGDTMSGYGATEIWTVIVNDDGTYSFANGGQNIGMADSYSSMDLGAVNDKWELTDLGEGLYNVKNVVRGNFMEWYDKYSNWSTYGSSSAATDPQFQIAFFPVPADVSGDTTTGIVNEGDQIVIYNVSAEGVLAMQDDNETSPSVNNAAASVSDGAVFADNGALIFTVERNGDYYRFYNETFGYLCSNGTGSNAFYQLEASDDADWLLAEYNGGYYMESRTAKFNGRYSQYLEYYAGAYKTYSMYNVTDKDIYTFHFYPCVNQNVTAGVVNAPAVVFGALTEANIGMDYTFSFTVDAPFGVESVSATCNGGAVEVTTTSDGYSVTVPADAVASASLFIVVSGVDTKGVTFEGSATVTVNDEPVISDLTPASGSQTMDDKRPTISATIVNGGEDPTVTMTVGDAAVDALYDNGVVSYTPDADMEDGRVTVTVTVERADGKTAAKTWSFTVGKAQYQLYFGQLHSHTTYSDGSGTLESALDYVKNLPESANVDFVAFTDHSNYFDKSGAANPEDALYDMSLATTYSQETWATYKNTIAAFNAANSDIIAIGGFEMTWSGGPGHINTFNTPGIVSRNNTVLNNKTSDAGMKAYYALLSRVEGADAISQFNHPGSTFGTFSDFAYWDAVLDTRMFLVEVGNGEGQIGQGGYYPSYEYYTMALDKGWHVAPTNNQDNHKGKWGNGNDARDVIITDNFTEEGIYEAIRNYRVYATEDKNLEILYTANDLLLGSIIEEVPEKLNISVSVSDPDASDSISKVEVIVNSGKTAYTWSNPSELATGILTCELDPTYSYYYIRVTQGDGDLAVTAPVWVGETLKLGISAVECGTATPVTGEELTITTTLFNSESKNATVKALTYQVKGGEVLGTDTTGYTIPASGTISADFKYTPTDARIMTITVTAIVEIDGQEYTFTMDITLDVQDADSLVYIGIDASHYNEYVAGNYKDSMGNFSQLAAEYNVRTVYLKTSEELIAACSNEKYKAIIFTAPSRRLPAAQAALLTYTDAEIEAIKAFNLGGGMVIFAGWSDAYEDDGKVGAIANFTADKHMAATQNAVLEALGSCLRISDDATYDDVRSAADSVEQWRLYFNTYGENELTVGVEVDPEHPYDRLYTEVFSHYGGASVYTADGTLPATVSPVVYGHATTYSVDVDEDGLGGNIPKYAYAEGDERLLVMAMEQIDGQGMIIVSGAAFMSNFEVQATIEDSGSEKNYSNYKICENLLKLINPVKITPIAEVQAKEGEGYKFTIEGVVTSNASGYDKDTAFFDCIYLQDDTAGINAFPVAGNYKIGDKVRITGTTSSYNGERQIAVTEIELISEGHTVEPTEITAAQLNDGSMLGSLITLKGFVKSFEYANGLVQTIMVEDSDGNVGRVFIDGYITTDKDVENLVVGCEITVTGLASYDNSFDGVAPRIRIRDREDVVCGAVPVDKTALEEAIGEAEGLNAEDYTEESYAAVEAALAEAEEVLADENATQEEVDAATAALLDAIAALEPAETVPEETVPEETVPEETVPEETVPEETVPEETIPEETVPEETVPEETVPEETVPEETVPEETVPEETVPEETVPEETEPEETVPEETVPEETVPEETVPEETEPEETVPEETVPEETVPEETVPEETIPEETEPEETEPEETEPEETTKPGIGDNVQTGDEFNPIIWVVIMLVALAGVVVLFILRKKMDK